MSSFRVMHASIICCMLTTQPKRYIVPLTQLKDISLFQLSQTGTLVVQFVLFGTNQANLHPDNLFLALSFRCTRDDLPSERQGVVRGWA